MPLTSLSVYKLQFMAALIWDADRRIMWSDWVTSTSSSRRAASLLSTQEYGTTFTVTHFLSAEAFLNRYRPVYDLVLMDICLPKTSGMDAAALLRRVDQSVSLIFQVPSRPSLGAVTPLF